MTLLERIEAGRTHFIAELERRNAVAVAVRIEHGTESAAYWRALGRWSRAGKCLERLTRIRKTLEG